MACYTPLTAYRSSVKNPETGKYPLSFTPKEAYYDLTVKVPCGQCIGCRLQRSRDWAIRCVHEASLHTYNSFITLTFSDKHLDPSGSLRTEDFQKFLKRLRRAIEPQKIRFYHCGEYGEQTNRPHHHACIFGYDFPDKTLWKTTNTGDRLYTSELLNKLWPYGYSVIGNVTYESAAYVARYILKKQTGKQSHVYTDAGIKPPYTTMSRRPGIAKDWIDKYYSDVYNHDYVINHKGQKNRPPRFYDDAYLELYPEKFDDLKKSRIKKAKKLDNDPEYQQKRLRTKQICKEQQIKQLIRPL